jgi:hypothetical protein
MLRIRICIAAAVAVSVLAAGGALAQTNDQVGQPLKLLAGLRPPHETKAHGSKVTVHTKTAHKTSYKTAGKFAARTKPVGKRHNKIATAQSDPAPAQIAPIAPPPNVWPTTDATAPTNAPVAETSPADNAPQQNTVTFEGQTVQVESANQVSEIDLAADNANPAPANAAPSDHADAAPASQTLLATPVLRATSQNADAVGSASWIAQVLAAFGGAVAAGAVAWFLIGSGPVRIYG